MKIRRSDFYPPVAVAICILCGCASNPPADDAGQGADVKVYTTAELNDNPYEVVGRLWVDSWRTAFRAPVYATQDEAIASLRAEAARRGANGLVNVYCLDQSGSAWFQSAQPMFQCYAVVIRVRPRSA
jgi:hypothetical protein